ncbi:MAG: DUF2071 domain-containing protein [Longimicrobiales bacterium]|nr:DUF2071 domain-containing protein [Longimicrobiales bacterium]
MPPFLTAEWRQLVMLNFVVDPGFLTPRVPSGTELDTWRGRTYVSVVGFLFLGSRLWGVPVLPWPRSRAGSTESRTRRVPPSIGSRWGPARPDGSSTGFVDALTHEPRSVFVAEGSSATVHRGWVV